MISAFLRVVALVLGLLILYLGIFSDFYVSAHWVVQLQSAIAGLAFLFYGVGGNKFLSDIPFFSGYAKTDSEKQNKK